MMLVAMKILPWLCRFLPIFLLLSAIQAGQGAEHKRVPVEVGWSYWWAWVWQQSDDPQLLERALAVAQTAIAQEDSLPEAHSLLSYVYLWKKQYAAAIAEAERAVSLAAHPADSSVLLANVLTHSGRPQEAIGLVEKARRLTPHPPPLYLAVLGWAYYLTGQSTEAVASLKKVLAANPQDLGAHLNLAATYSELGHEQEAQAEVRAFLKRVPGFSLKGLKQRFPFKDEAVLERYVDALRKAGLK